MTSLPVLVSHIRRVPFSPPVYTSDPLRTKPAHSRPSSTGTTLFTFQLCASQRIRVLSRLTDRSVFCREEKSKARTTETWESSVDIAFRLARSHIRILPSSLPEARRNLAVLLFSSISILSSVGSLGCRDCFLFFFEIPLSC